MVLPGYEPLLDPTRGQVIGATPCPVGTYSPAGQACTPCPGGLTTQQPKSTSVTACLAAPGQGYYPDGIPEEFPDSININALVVPCPNGWYKPGWDLNNCSRCGVGFFTEGTGSTLSDDCYIPGGWGSKPVDTTSTSSSSAVAVLEYSTTVSDTKPNVQQPQQLVASKCGNGSFGASSRHYGLEPMPCQVR